MALKGGAFCYKSPKIRWRYLRYGKSLSKLVEERVQVYPCSGEISKRLKNPKQVIAGITRQYFSNAKAINTIDGKSIGFDKWRFNLRSSNTEPVVHLSVESKPIRVCWKVKQKSC